MVGGSYHTCEKSDIIVSKCFSKLAKLLVWERFDGRGVNLHLDSDFRHILFFILSNYRCASRYFHDVIVSIDSCRIIVVLISTRMYNTICTPGNHGNPFLLSFKWNFSMMNRCPPLSCSFRRATDENRSSWSSSRSIHTKIKCLKTALVMWRQANATAYSATTCLTAQVRNNNTGEWKRIR